MAAAGPQGPAPRRAGVRRRPAGGPDAGDPPGIQPVHDGGQPGERAVGERLLPAREHPDLHADPAFGVDVAGLDVAGLRGVLVRAAERAGSAESGDQLHDVAGDRVPDEMAGPALVHELARGRLGSGPGRNAVEGQPDRAGRAAAQGTAVRCPADAPCVRHPSVCHRLPLPGKGARPYISLTPGKVISLVFRWGDRRPPVYRRKCADDSGRHSMKMAPSPTAQMMRTSTTSARMAGPEVTAPRYR